MTRVPDLFQPKLTEKQSRVAELRLALAVAEAELRVWEEAINLITSPVGSWRESQRAPSANLATEERSAAVAQAREPRGLSEQWRNIFAGTAQFYPRAATLDEMIEISVSLGTPVERNTLRSQTSIYSNRGILERVGQGAYRLTESGAFMLDIPLPAPEMNTADVGEETEAASSAQEDAALE